MKNMMLAIAALLAVTVSANAGVDFDRGVDIKSVVAQAQISAPHLPEAKAGIPSYSTRDCRKVEFTAESPLASAPISLHSMEMYQDCQNLGAPAGQICIPRPEYHNAMLNVTVTEALELKPGQKEIFEVCMHGPFLSLRPVSTVYEYKVRQDLEGFKLTPKGLIAAEKGLDAAVYRLPMDKATNVCFLRELDGKTCVYKCTGDTAHTLPAEQPEPNVYPGLYNCPQMIVQFR